MNARYIMHEIDAFIRKERKVNFNIKEEFIQNMVFMYHVIVASENLLATAVQVSMDCPKLHEYYLIHWKEEIGHEKHLARDLLTANVDINKLPIPADARAMCGSVYYDLHHRSPVCLLGHMLVLESFPMSMNEIEMRERMYGTELLRTLRYHAEHDIDHSKDLWKIIDSLNVQDLLIVRESALQTAIYLCSAMRQFIKKVS